MKKTYTVSAANRQGAFISVGIDYDHINGGKEFTSIKEAARIARKELGPGWRVYITDSDGTIVKEFTIR